MFEGAAVTVGLALVVAGCGGLPQAAGYGHRGQGFVVAFAEAPTEHDFVLQHPHTQYGTSIAHRTIWDGGNATVWVDQLTAPVAPGHVDGFLRSYLPTATGGRMVTRFGLPAAIESIPCFTPAGSCPGNIAELVILDHRTLYEVRATGAPGTDAAVLASFRPGGS